MLAEAFIPGAIREVTACGQAEGGGPPIRTGSAPIQRVALKICKKYNFSTSSLLSRRISSPEASPESVPVTLVTPHVVMSRWSSSPKPHPKGKPPRGHSPFPRP